MTREIKFRARQLNGGEWVFGYYLVDANGRHCIGTRDNCYEVVPDTVGQFTGLLDNNGKEIYEGDIIRGAIVVPQLLTGQTRENCSTAMGGVVGYDHSCFTLKAIQSMCDPEREGNVNWFPFASDDPYQGRFEDMEIIGNIYSNPELLKN